MAYEDFTKDEQRQSLTYLPSLADQKKIDFITGELQKIEQSTADIRKKIQKCRQNYRCEYQNKYTKTGREKFFAPLTSEFVNSIAPKLKLLKEALVANPTEESDTLKAKVFEFLLRFQTGKMRFFERLNTEEKRNLGIDGTIVAKICWDFEEKEEFEEARPAANLRERIAEYLGRDKKSLAKVKVIKDEPKIDFIDLLDCYIDPQARSIQEAPMFAVRYVENVDDLKNNKLYKNTQFVTGDETLPQNTWDSSSTQNYDVGASNPTSEIKKVEVFECWTDDRVITIANRNNPVIIRDQVNPFKHGKKPFEECWYIKTGRRWYGIGVGELLLDLQRLLNEWANQRIENREILLNKMFILKRGSVKDIRQLISRPAGFIEVDDINSIKPLEFSDITQKAFEEESNIFTWAQRITNSWELQSGGGGTVGTATEATIRAKGVEGYFGDIAMNMRDFIIRCVGQLAQLNQQFLDKEMSIRIMGDTDELAPLDEAMGVSPEQAEDMGKFRFIHLDDINLLRGQYDFDIDLDNSQTTDRAVKTKQLIEFAMFAQGNPVIAQKVNWPALAKEILSLQGVNTDKIFTKNETKEQAQPMPEAEGGLPPGVPNEQAIMTGAMAAMPSKV